MVHGLQGLRDPRMQAELARNRASVACLASAVLVSAAMASACLRRASRCSDMASGDRGQGFFFALIRISRLS